MKLQFKCLLLRSHKLCNILSNIADMSIDFIYFNTFATPSAKRRKLRFLRYL